MRQKKKIAASLLFLCLLFGTACGNSTGNGANDIRNEAAISAAASALEENGMKKIGEPVQWTNPRGPVMEFTVQKVEIFDHFTDLGPVSYTHLHRTEQRRLLIQRFSPIRTESGGDA